MPQSQASLEEKLQKMAANASALRAAGQALREATEQPEATATTRTVTLVTPPPSPLVKT